MPVRRFLLPATVAMALLAPTAASAAGGQAKPKAEVGAPTVAKPLGQLSKTELRAKLSGMSLPDLAALFEPIEGDELPEMFADGTQDGFDLVYRGVKATAFDDADGTDEVAVWIALVRPTATGYTKTLHKLASPTVLSAAHAGTNAGAITLFHGDRGPALLLGAVIEDDDGSAAQRMAELDVLLEQAIAAATILRDDGDDPLEVLHAMVVLGRAMLGTDPDRPALDVRPIRTSDWDRLWDLEPTREGGRTAATTTAKTAAQASPVSFVYKLALGGRAGDGRYQLRFDVPAKAGREPRRVVKLDLDELLVVTPPDALKAGADKQYFVRVCIASTGLAGLDVDAPASASCVTKKLWWAHSAVSWEPLTVFRRMRQGNAKITVLSWWLNAGGSEFKFLDLDAGDDGFASLTANVGPAAGTGQVQTTGDGDGGALHGGQCFSCGFPSGAAIGTLTMRVAY